MSMFTKVFLDEPFKKFKAAFTSTSQKMTSLEASNEIKVEEIIIIGDEDKGQSNIQIQDSVASEESDDENYSKRVQIPKNFRQKIFVHKTISKKQSQIMTDRRSFTGMLRKGKSHEIIAIQSVMARILANFKIIEFQTLKQEVQNGLIFGRRYENISMRDLIELYTLLTRKYSQMVKRNSFLETEIEVMKLQDQ